jgi:hypothetical protein
LAQSQLIIHSRNRHVVTSLARFDSSLRHGQKGIPIIQVFRIAAHGHLDDIYFACRGAIGDKAPDEILDIVRNLNSGQSSVLPWVRRTLS